MKRATKEMAFPTVKRIDGKLQRIDGMELRDYFAIRLYRKFPTTPANLWQFIRYLLGFRYIVSSFRPEEEAERAYSVADILIKQRSK